METLKDVRKRLGQKAKDLRDSHGLTQEVIAQKTGIAQDALSVFERKGERLGIEKIDALFNFFGYQIDISEKKTPRPVILTDLPSWNGLSPN